MDKLEAAIRNLPTAADRGDSPRERKRADSIRRAEASETRPKPGPKPVIPGAVKDGGVAAITKHRLTILSFQDRRLSLSAKVLVGAFLWRVQPGRVFRLSMKSLGAAIHMPYRTVKDALHLLKDAHYMARYKGGWISPALEAQLPESERVVTGRQLAFEFARDWDQLGAGRHLRMVEPAGAVSAPADPGSLLITPSDGRPAGAISAPGGAISAPGGAISAPPSLSYLFHTPSEGGPLPKGRVSESDPDPDLPTPADPGSLWITPSDGRPTPTPTRQSVDAPRSGADGLRDCRGRSHPERPRRDPTG